MVRLVEHLEGRTKLLVPSVSLSQDPPPTSPVFFNPAAALNRDVSVALTAAVGGSTFCDSMAGVGARGIRVAKEAKEVESVTLVDFNLEALKAARRSAALNGVRRKCVFADSETSSYLFSRFGRDQRFDFVDVDPFGTPARQLQAALCATKDGGFLSVTATDTAVLCGVYPEVALRRYGALSVNNHFNHESGIRVLAGSIARQAAQIDIGVGPVAAHSTRHYLRLYLRVRVGATAASSSLGRIGYVAWCPSCGHTASYREQERRCEVCGRKVKLAGPLWIGALAHEPTVESARKAAGERGLSSAAEVLGSLEGLDDFPPWSFSIEKVSSTLKVPTVSESSLYRVLQDAGFKVMRTPFEKTGIKTDAEYSAVLAAVKSASSRLAPTGP